MEILNLSGLLLVFAQLVLMPGLGASIFDCTRECFGPYADYESLDCETISTVLDCYNINQDACDSDFNVFFWIQDAQADNQAQGCEVTPTGGNVTPLDPCPSLMDEAISVTSMSSAVVTPDLPPSPECTVPRVPILRQCSLFMDSQLRAFDSYRGGLETCSLPGSWFLFHHQSLTIEVEGTNFEMGSNHTRFTKVNVTFHPHECNPTGRTYTVVNSRPLPLDFTPSQPGNSTSPLQLLFGTDDSVVTLMDTWLNATIVIRKYMEFLSVTLQVPREVALESDGLCTGCPGHMYINITSFNDLYPSLCPEVNSRVLGRCFDHGGVVNVESLVHIQNNSYLDACVYSLFKIGRALDVLTMFNAIADDATMLMNVGEHTMTFPPIPDDDLTSPPTDTTTTQSTTAIIKSTMELSASTSHHHNSKLPLTLLTLLHGILVLR